MSDAVLYVVQFVFSILSFLFVARFLMQACRVDFYNPVSQGFVKITDPLLKPLRLVIPGFRNFDLASLAAAVLMEVLLLVAISSLSGQPTGSFGQILAVGFYQVALLIVRIFWWSILIVIVASFLAPGSGHPALHLLSQITEPLLGPARRLLPAMGGLDFSPILVFLLLGLLQEVVLPNLLRSIF